MSNASIAQEFYKIRDKWATIDKKKWNMAVWVCDYADLDIINKFMDIEASPIGVFDDFFFQFQTIFQNEEEFESKLWQEFLSWFGNSEEETNETLAVENNKYDMVNALKKDGYLPKDYAVNRSLPPTFQSITKELIRIKTLITKQIPDLEKTNLVLYFLPSIHNAGFEDWLINKLHVGLPEGIRLAALDLKGKPVLSNLRRQKKIGIVQLPIELDMANAIRNEMDKDSTGGKANDPAARFQKQVRLVMDATVDKALSIEEETDKLVIIAKQADNLGSNANKQATKDNSLEATAYMVNGTAFHSIEMKEEAMLSVEKAIELTGEKLEKLEALAVENKDKADELTTQKLGSYNIWRSAMMIKAALLVNEKRKHEEALSCYLEIAEQAAKQGDAYYAMEAYRVRAQINFHKRKRAEAWEDVIFSLQAGTNLQPDYRLSSSFLYSAALALNIAEDDKEPVEINALKEKYAIYIGENWQTLLAGIDVTVKKVKPPKPTKV